MRTNHAGAVAALALLLSACGSPGSATPSADEPSVAATESPTPPADACGDWGAEASDDVVLLHFPCGSLGEMAAVERAVTQTGDERVAQVVQLYLVGPSAGEREVGFSTMLAPGDIDIVEVSPPRLVLDFPSEVINVSTSAGSRAVLDGLRQTLIGLNGIEEIELRLRNDCAAFFEWVQVGPTCHVLTADGLASAPAPSPAAAAVQVATCEHSSGAYQIVVPEDWWTNPEFEDAELGLVAACRFFAPSDFDVTSASSEAPIPDGTAIWIDYLENGCVGYINEILSSRETTVAGYSAVVSELAFAKEQAGPPHTYEYVVTLTPDTDCETGGRYIYAVTTRDYAGDFENNRTILDQMMETIEVRYP